MELLHPLELPIEKGLFQIFELTSVDSNQTFMHKTYFRTVVLSSVQLHEIY